MAEKEDRRAMELEANRSKDQPLTFSARRDRVCEPDVIGWLT